MDDRRWIERNNDGCERDPTLSLNIVNRASQAEDAQGGYHPLPGTVSPQWCVCSKCR